jgi:AcrR family transcriptional regulator
MDANTAKRMALAAAAADHLLAHGAGETGLRTLARAAGTSDRMLLYYFKDKDDLLRAALEVVVTRMEASMEPLVPRGIKLAPDRLLATLAEGTHGEALGSAMRLWIEIAAQAAQGSEPWRTAASVMVERSIAWIEARLDLADPRREAARLYALLDGAALLEAVGRSDLADRALGRQPVRMS